MTKVVKLVKKRDNEMSRSLREAYNAHLNYSNDGKDILGYAMVSFLADGSHVTSLRISDKYPVKETVFASAVKDALLKRS